MSAAVRRSLLLVTLAAALPATALAQHGDGHAPPPAGGGSGATVVMEHAAFAPMHVSVLVGERVEWVNGSGRSHTVVSASAGFDSGRVGVDRSWGHTFPARGTFSYVCTLHRGMTGTVDVAGLLLRPLGAVVRGEPLGLGGRGLPGGGPVTIERQSGAGFAPVSTVPRAADGSFHAPLASDSSATFRAVSGGEVSAPVHVEVVERRSLALSTKRGKERRIIGVRVRPGARGATVKLQRYLRERFGWWTVSRRTLNAAGRARFSIRRSAKGRVRVVLTKPDGETPLAVSRTMRVRG